MYIPSGQPLIIIGTFILPLFAVSRVSLVQIRVRRQLSSNKLLLLLLRFLHPDERRNRNTPLPTVIRDGKVVLGGDGRTRLENLRDQPRTIVRSDPGTSVHHGRE